MKFFKDCGSFAAFLASLPPEVKAAQKAGLEAGAKMVEVEAKAEIGHYQGEAGPFAEWAPLSAATLDGFHHPLAGYIQGKVELGYAPPDNPLEREGHLRDSISHGLENDHMAVVGSPDEVALWQEMGTPNAMYPIPPRSFLGGAAYREAPKIVDQLAGRVVWAIRGLPKRND